MCSSIVAHLPSRSPGFESAMILSCLSRLISDRLRNMDLWLRMLQYPINDKQRTCALSGEANLIFFIILYFCPFSRRVNSYKKQFAPQGTNGKHLFVKLFNPLSSQLFYLKFKNFVLIILPISEKKSILQFIIEVMNASNNYQNHREKIILMKKWLPKWLTFVLQEIILSTYSYIVTHIKVLYFLHHANSGNIKMANSGDPVQTAPLGAV